ncbi:MAG: fasciclin domain-containing protein [Salinibacter sp.]
MIRNRLVSLLRSPTAASMVLALFVGLSLTACDMGSQNIQFTSGSNLTVNTIKAPGFIPNYDSATTAEYQVRAFSIDKEYQWSVSGIGSIKTTRRQGENVIVSASTPGSYTVTVSTTIDGKKYTGSASATVDYPTATKQAERYGLTAFQSAVSAAGLVGALNNEGTPPSGWTAFVPSNTAFLNALDADGSGSIESDERPAPGVLARVLQYHALPDSLTSTEIATQSVKTLLHPKETLQLDGSAGTVTGTNQTVNLTTTDLATSDGVLHVVDGVLLPASVVSINDQTVSREIQGNDTTDVVRVEGTYVQDGGFIALHKGSASGEIIGVSSELAPGFSGNENPIEIELNSTLSDTTTVVAMPHKDDPDDGQFTFNDPVGGDPPYFRGTSNVPVIDPASVATP